MDRRVVEDVTRRGRQYVTCSDGTQWSRKVDKTTNEPLEDWKEVETMPGATGPEPRQLHVVAESQAEGEPKHWCLCVTREGSPSTRWQVTGDAEQMHYAHDNVDPFLSESFAWHQTLNPGLTDSQYETIDRVAHAETPPHAKSRREVTENCQGWVIRVLLRLAGQGIVKEDAVAGLQKHMDPI